MLGKNVRRSRWRESGQKIVGRRLSQSGWTHSASPMVCRITITPTGKGTWLLINSFALSQQSSYLFLMELRVVNLTCEKDFFLTFHIISEVTTSLIPSVLYRPFRLTPTKPQWGRKGDTSYSHLRGEEMGSVTRPPLSEWAGVRAGLSHVGPLPLPRLPRCFWLSCWAPSLPHVDTEPHTRCGRRAWHTLLLPTCNPISEGLPVIL